MRLLLLFVLLALFTPCTANNETAVRSAISAIWKAVLLFKKEYKEFNLDGLVGFKLLLEQMKGILEKLDAKKDLYTCLQMKRLKKILNEMLNKASYFAKQRDPEYFEEFHELIGDQFWTLPTSWKQITPGLVFREWLPDKSLCLIEEVSDECISSLLGNLNENKKPCVVTTSCWKKMIQKGCTDYSLSHQLLFFIVGKMSQFVNLDFDFLVDAQIKTPIKKSSETYYYTKNKLKRCRNNLFVTDASYYTNVFCANMMKINVDIERSGYPLHQQDLFMENIMLCGLCGYSDFYKLEWMNKIISWQDPIIGCFVDIGHSLNPRNAANENHTTKRVKRRERMFLDACLSHKTAMAVGALGGFLYYSTFM